MGKQQTALTEKYLASIPERAELHKRLEKIYNYEQQSDIWKQDGKYYLWKQDGLKQQPELCVLDSFHGTPQTILDPNKLSPDGHGIARDVRLTNDGKYAVFKFADGGQDATRTVVYDLKAGSEIKELPKGEEAYALEKSTGVKMPDDSTNITGSQARTRPGTNLSMKITKQER